MNKSTASWSVRRRGGDLLMPFSAFPVRKSWAQRGAASFEVPPHSRSRLTRLHVVRSLCRNRVHRRQLDTPTATGYTNVIWINLCQPDTPMSSGYTHENWIHPRQLDSPTATGYTHCNWIHPLQQGSSTASRFTHGI